MINKKYATKFCKEDISLIENYDKAIADTTQTWDCHHRREISECRSTKQLIDIGEYYNRPACELIFLAHSEHIRLHMKDNNPNFGKHHSEATKMKMSEALSKPILQFTKSGELVREWYGMRKAAKELGIAYQSISVCCRGKLKSAGGFIWKYSDSK